MAAALTAWRSNLMTSLKSKRHQTTTNQNRRFLAAIVERALESRAI